MSQDKEKLMRILSNLERDYEAGLISEDKYIYLSNQYKHKIETIDVSNRIRAMQGRSPSDSSRVEVNEIENQEENDRLVRKYLQNPEPYTKSRPKQEKEESGGSKWYILVATVFLLVAFGVGISFGISNFGIGEKVTNLVGDANASINDTDISRG